MILYGGLEESPLGRIWIALSDDGLYAVHIGGSESGFLENLAPGVDQPLPDQAAIQPIAGMLADYFRGSLRQFDVQIDWSQFTDFQRAALQTAYHIPYGEVRTYGHIAQEIGRSMGAARAVGRTMATNPIPIIIPCHRVVGVKGDLRGYGGPGGIRTKAWLLELEGYEQVQQKRFPW